MLFVLLTSASSALVVLFDAYFITSSMTFGFAITTLRFALAYPAASFGAVFFWSIQARMHATSRKCLNAYKLFLAILTVVMIIDFALIFANRFYSAWLLLNLR